MKDAMMDATDGNASALSLADHLVAFGRVLRRAGLKVGSGQIIDAVLAVEKVGVQRRDDFYQALFAIFVTRYDQIELFDQAFHLFWRAPSRIPSMMNLMLPSFDAPPPKGPRTRVQQALQEPDEQERRARAQQQEKEIELDVVLTYSPVEVLKKKDFSEFTAEEEAAAKEMIRDMRWPVAPHATRRRSPREKGRFLDLHHTVRGVLRNQGEFVELAWEGRKRKMRPIIVLCDISGSMERYSRMLLHFMHAATGGLHHVESFVFGTRLTRITRYLRRRDVDEAVHAVSDQVTDWAGGTRIGEALHAFNYEWLRRVLPSHGVVLVISDGWDRGAPEVLDGEMDRLARSCHRLIWLNPLLGYENYEPLTRGIQAALPHLDDFLPVHNLESLVQLGRLLSDLERHRSAGWKVARQGRPL